MPYPDRRAEPGAVLKTQTAAGESVRLNADDEGIVRVHNEAQQEAADLFQLPVARAKAEAKAADTKTKSEG